MSTPAHRTAPWSSYFVTTKCWSGRTIFQVPEIAEIMTQSILEYRDRGTYRLHEFVIMPDHLHLLLTPGRETSLEKAMQLIKGGSSHRIHKARGHKMEIWQAGFYDWTIRDAEDWATKVTYIRMNPVRARLVENAKDWLHSSANERFGMDPIPVKYLRPPMTSGAKAPECGATLTQGLKPLPPKEEEKTPGLKPFTPGASGNVGPKGPTPGGNSGTRGATSIAPIGGKA